MKIKINRQLAGVEDIAWGTGTVDQLRGGKTVTITEINAGNMPFDESLTLKEALDTRYPEIAAVGENIAIVTTVGENILNVNIVGGSIEDVNTVAREILSIVDVHLNMPNVMLTAQHSEHIEIIGNDLVEQGTMYIHDLGSITEPVETPAKGKSDITTVANSIDHVDTVSENIDDVNIIATHIDNVNMVGEDLMMVGVGHNLDGGLITDPIDHTPGGISNIETVSTNIDSVIIDAENIDSIIAVAESIDNVDNVGDNISDVITIGNDLSLSGFAYMMDCGAVDDPVVVVPQTQSNIVTVADNMEDINTVALHMLGIMAVTDDLASGTINNAIDGGLITDPVDSSSTGTSYIETVATNMADITLVGQNIQTIIDGYNAAVLAIAAKDDAIAARNKAEKWAEENFNVEVETGQYSAKHWATVASNIVGSGVIDDSIIGLATTYSSDKILDEIGIATTDMVQISSPTENTIAVYKDGSWQAVEEFDLGQIA